MNTWLTTSRLWLVVIAVAFVLRLPALNDRFYSNDEATYSAIAAKLVAGGTYAECSWGFYLSQIATGRARLLIRTRAVSSPAWLRRMPFGLIDAYLSHVELSNIKRRVEQTAARSAHQLASPSRTDGRT